MSDQASQANLTGDQFMAPINTDALESLQAAIAGLLPEPPDPKVSSAFLIMPKHCKPTGLGGLVDYDRERQGLIYGCRIEATLIVTLTSTEAAALQAMVATVVQNLLGAERKTLLGLGLLDLRLAAISHTPRPSPVVKEERYELTFELLYEYLKRPEVPEDRIDEVLAEIRLWDSEEVERLKIPQREQ
jgi:hypothetical protein